MLNARDIIALKRDGRELSAEEIGFFMRGIVRGDIADYQASAWLMAVFLRGMSERETLDLTLAMRDSGDTIDLSGLSGGPTLDKHSTGGVGDKTTLVVVPLLAAAGVPMLKMSGRGLGFSGGTVDKLEAIPGFRSGLSIAEAVAQVQRVGAALIAQTADLAPADRILYALRDVTATVESVPLIASSIMSKKLAAGAQRIVLDVKVGSGAFMPTLERAEALARALIAIGEGAGVPTSALLSDMDTPLGRMVGNALEVREAIQTLQDDPATDVRLRGLCLELAAHGLVAAERERDPGAARLHAETLLRSGAGAEKLAAISAAQGGPASCDGILAALPQAPIRHEVNAPRSGVVVEVDAGSVGRLSMALGAGRARKSDVVDPAVGIELHIGIGSRLEAGQRLATLHLREQDAPRAEMFADALRGACRLAAEDEAVYSDRPILLATLSGASSERC